MHLGMYNRVQHDGLHRQAKPRSPIVDRLDLTALLIKGDCTERRHLLANVECPFFTGDNPKGCRIDLRKESD